MYHQEVHIAMLYLHITSKLVQILLFISCLGAAWGRGGGVRVGAGVGDGGG